MSKLTQQEKEEMKKIMDTMYVWFFKEFEKWLIDKGIDMFFKELTGKKKK